METQTGSMDAGARTEALASDAGLVLLYAPSFASLPAAYVFGGTLAIFGRDPGPSGHVIDDHAVSRLHARIVHRDGRWTLHDLSSRNGTFLNDLRVMEAALAHGDRVRIGNALFKFVVRGATRHRGRRIDGSVTADTDAEDAMGALIAGLVGGCSMRELARESRHAARSGLPVLVCGETGTGKEIIARALHDLSERPGRFVSVNCAAIPSHLVESELFGVQRGAFTGAHRDRVGFFERADRGTLFLDEIGDMPLEAQAKLLRTLESGEVAPLGGVSLRHVDIRLVCATHRSLHDLVARGAFRDDLYARIHGCVLSLPPLRERKEDLYALVLHFAAEAGRPDVRPNMGFMAALCAYDWPRNVRELKMLVQRAVSRCEGRELSADLVSGLVSDPPAGPAVRENEARSAVVSDDPSGDELRVLLTQHGGNVSSVARALGKHRKQVQRWIARYGLDPSQFR